MEHRGSSETVPASTRHAFGLQETGDVVMQQSLTRADISVLQTAIASVRTSLLAGFVLLASALLPAVIHAQVPPDIPAPSDTVYQIRLADGSLIIGRVTELDEGKAVLTTAGGSRLEIGRDQVREVRRARGRVVDGEFWNDDPNRTRSALHRDRARARPGGVICGDLRGLLGSYAVCRIRTHQPYFDHCRYTSSLRGI